MNRLARPLVVAAAVAALAGCGDSKPAPVPTDPDSVKQLEEMQKQASQGEGKPPEGQQGRPDVIIP